MKILILVFVVLIANQAVFTQNYNCTATRKNETTYWGGNIRITQTEPKSYRLLRGTIFQSDGITPLKNTLVEVFTNPEYLLSNEPIGRKSRPKQKRVAVCRTGINGRFSFPNLPPGKYELRSSNADAAAGWNVTQVYVVIKAKGSKKALRVGMTLGT